MKLCALELLQRKGAHKLDDGGRLGSGGHRRNASKPDETGLADLVLGPYEGPILPAHKRALLEQSDVVVCTLPGTEETRHFLSSAEFDAMKGGATFVSVGRGIAVDESAQSRCLPTRRSGSSQTRSSC